MCRMSGCRSLFIGFCLFSLRFVELEHGNFKEVAVPFSSGFVCFRVVFSSFFLFKVFFFLLFLLVSFSSFFVFCRTRKTYI